MTKHCFVFCVLLFSLQVPELAATVYSVAPGPAEAISEAFAKAKPGDTIQLLPGVYTGTVEVSVSGAPDQPIILSGLDWGEEEKAVIDAGGGPARKADYPAIRFRDAHWITVQDIEVVNAWSDVFQIKDSSYISIRGCDVAGGTTVVAAHGTGSHHILAEDCTWEQEKGAYLDLDWAEMHHGDLVYLNGGFYGGTDSAGGAVIRYNDIGYAFNGLRWWLNDAATQARQAQSNIEIYDNYFHHVRDNMIEPERFTWNLHVYHNRLNSCAKGAVSIDGVTGGEIFFYGNTGLWARDGADDYRPWTVYKFNDYERKPHLDYPFYIFNNSWSYATAFVRGSKMRKANDHLRHFNNAYVFVEEGYHFGLVDWAGQDCQFDYDMAAAPWDQDVVDAGYEEHGFPDTNPGFQSVEADDFRLAAESPARDKGTVIDDFHLWYLGDGPDIGAYEGEQRVYGLPFVYREPPGGGLYQEMPRIVRVFEYGNKLVAFFSSPLDPETLTPERILLKAGDEALTILSAEIPAEDYPQAVVLTLDEIPAAREVEFQFDPALLGANGQPVTTWAGDTRLVQIPPEATLVGPMKAILEQN